MLKRTLTIILFLITIVTVIHAQVPPKITNDKLFGKECFYFKIMPTTHAIKGLLVLVPGFGEHPYSVTVQTSIVQEAIKNDISVIMVSLSPENDKFTIGRDAADRLSNMIEHFYTTNKINAKMPLFVGGFSIGGTTAISLYANSGYGKWKFSIKKIFAIDPPLDMNRLHSSLLRSGDSTLVKRLEVLKEENETLSEGLLRNSIYSPQNDGTDLPDYSKTSLRIYSEPDVLWWIKNRSMDYYDMNVVDCAGYVNQLFKKNKENKVELILTKDRGIRNGNQKHPHSWSLAEPRELIAWLLE